MSAPAMQPRNMAERRQQEDRRHLCLLEFAPDRRSGRDRRSGFDRREIFRIMCHVCARPLFATRSENRRLMLSESCIEYLRDAGPGRLFSCPHCHTRYEKYSIQLQQDQLLLRRIPAD